MQQPFQELGGQLRLIREKRRQSVAEVSGAVEIDTEVLERIENGNERPSEDILMLLVSYFGLQDDEAVGLWELAGYDRPKAGNDNYPMGEDGQNRQVVMMLALDTRILYSDGAHINANKNGVVLNFLQNSGTGNNQQVPIARIGMSYDQTQELLRVLNQTMAQAKAVHAPKHLPAPKPKSSKEKKRGAN